MMAIKSPNRQLIEAMQQRGWMYTGVCACDIKKDELVKRTGVKRYKILIWLSKDYWELKEYNKGVIRSGNSSNLIERVGESLNELV